MDEENNVARKEICQIQSTSNFSRAPKNGHFSSLLALAALTTQGLN